jgi:RNA polymerase sigma-70 factor (sigma-E family)
VTCSAESVDEEFTRFVEGTANRLLHAADLLTGDRARAEDLVQNALARTYSHWSSVRRGHPEAYVRRAVLNGYLDWWRRVRPRELPLPDGDPGAASGDHAADVVRRDAVQRALAGLTRRERAVIVLRYWFDLSEAQIAEELHIAPGTVKSTASRALARLRESDQLREPDQLRGGKDLWDHPEGGMRP